MADRTEIIINNVNQQNNGCGCGPGCGCLVFVAVLLFPLGMFLAAINGDQSAWWIPIGALLTLLEVVLAGGLVFAWLDAAFDWGYLRRREDR